MHFLKASKINKLSTAPFVVFALILITALLSGCSIHTVSMPVDSYELSKEPFKEPSDSDRFKKELVVNIKYKDGTKDKFYLFNYNLEIKNGKKDSGNEINLEVFEDNTQANDTVTWILPPDQYKILDTQFREEFGISLQNYEDMINDTFDESDDFNGK